MLLQTIIISLFLAFTGWPCFNDMAEQDAIRFYADESQGMRRIQTVCKMVS